MIPYTCDREYVVSWTQTMATEAAKERQREATRQHKPDSNEIVALFVESHPDRTTAEIVAGTGLGSMVVGDALFRLKRQGRVTGGKRAWPCTPTRWKVKE